VSGLKLNWYWMEFKELPNFCGLCRGVGVTAFTDDDAIQLVSQKIDPELKNSIATVKQLLSLNEITDEHILPNMGNELVRGVWFPK